MKSPSKSPRKEDLTAEYGYTVIYEQLSEGGCQVFVPALPGIVTYGRTVEEAREMAQDAILCHVRALHKDGEEIPDAPLQAKLAPLTGSSDFRVLLPLPSSETAAHSGSLSGVLRDASCRLSPKDCDTLHIS